MRLQEPDGHNRTELRITCRPLLEAEAASRLDAFATDKRCGGALRLAHWAVPLEDPFNGRIRFDAYRREALLRRGH